MPRQKGEEILCYFTSHKFIIACKSHLLFFFAPILILDVLKWFCASDHREEFNITDPLKLRSCLRPYHGEITGSRLISKVKHRRAWVVLGWVTTWEVRVL